MIRALAFTLVFAVCACQCTPPPEAAGDPSAIVAVSGELQSGVAGTALASGVAIRVTDANGKPVVGLEVLFLADSGGRVGADTVLTDADGKAATSWILGARAGEQTVRASLRRSAIYFVFHATATPGEPAQLSSTVQPSSARAGEPLTGVSFAVLDALDNVVTDFAGTVSVALGQNTTGATLGGTTSVNAVAGIATFSTLTINKAGAGYTLTFSSEGLSSTTTNGFDITAGAASQAVLASGSGQAGPVGMALALPVVVRFTDTFGNPIAGLTVTFTSGATPLGTEQTDEDGEVSFSWTLGATVGTQTLTATSGAATVNIDATATAVTVPLVFTSISAGEEIACGVVTTGDAYCWGKNSSGQLGNDSWDKSAVPVRVLGGLSFKEVSATSNGACGLTTAGKAYCWGSNSTPGRLGFDGNFSRVPLAVAGDLTFAHVGLRNANGWGLTDAGAAYIWGSNEHDQLGALSNVANSSTPLEVTGGRAFSSLSAGSWSCGVSAGAGYCWGIGITGGLGNGTYTSSTVPVPVSGDITWRVIDVGSGGTSCGVSTTGLAYCWGARFTVNWDNAPVHRPSTSLFVTVSVGYNHACALTAEGAAWCWGNNGSGQLGTGESTAALDPVPVTGGLVFATISAGTNFTCGVTTTGVAYCWGSNSEGDLGTGAASDPTFELRVPSKVAGQP